VSKLKEPYKRWVLSNIETLSVLENLLRTCLFLMPGRFRDSEVTLEFFYSMVGLFSLNHDIIVLEYLEKERGNLLLSRLELPSKSNLNTMKWLSFFRNMELFFEMLSRQILGNKSKWKVIFLIEIVKAFLKLQLLWDNGGRMLLHQTVPQYRDHPILKSYLTQKETRNQKRSSRQSRKVSSAKWEQFKQVVQQDEKIQTGERHILAELLHIFRPIVYLLLMFRWGPKSWKPFIVSFLMDFQSLRHYNARIERMNESEHQEGSRRKMLLFLYLVRSPLFDFLSKHRPGLKSITDRMKNMIPVVGSFFSLLYDNIVVYRQHYFYISGSD